jgi:hypothetical protein
VWKQIKLYPDLPSREPGVYILEQTLFALVGWVPTIVGIAPREVL